MLASKVSTSPSTSYIAFLLGACVVSQSQEEEKAASEIQSQIFPSSVVMSPCMFVMFVLIVLMSLSTVCTSSYTAFLLGACVVSPSQELQYAVSLITALALPDAVLSTYALITLF